MEKTADRFKILSLDGGGVRGYLSILILANIEKYLNDSDGANLPIGKRFDLIAGTSTGGLIALGLAIGKTANELVDFYEKKIPKVFSDENRRNIFKKAFSSKYDPSQLKIALEEFFGGKTLHDVVVDVCVTTTSLQNGYPRLYKSGYLKRNESRLDESLVDIGLATSAAPSYFPAHSSKHSSNLIDGGLCANNPSMVALVEACQFEKASHRGVNVINNSPLGLRENACLLSIGTGAQCSMPYDYKKLASGGGLSWYPVFPILEITMQGQSLMAHHQSKFLMGDAYMRINPDLKFPMALDDAKQMHELKNLADINYDVEGFLKRFM